MQRAFFLKRGDTLALARASGTTVEVTGGDAWITEHGDINDYVIRDAGWQARSDGLVLIHAFRTCRVALSGPARAEVQLRRRGEIRRSNAGLAIAGLLRILLRWFSRPLPRS